MAGKYLIKYKEPGQLPGSFALRIYLQYANIASRRNCAHPGAIAS